MWLAYVGDNIMSDELFVLLDFYNSCHTVHMYFNWQGPFKPLSLFYYIGINVGREVNTKSPQNCHKKANHLKLLLQGASNIQPQVSRDNKIQPRA